MRDEMGDFFLVNGSDLGNFGTIDTFIKESFGEIPRLFKGMFIIWLSNNSPV